METITISYASFLLLFAYRWPLLLHWKSAEMRLSTREYIWSWKRILNFYYIPLCAYNEFNNSILHSLSLFSNWDQILNSYHVSPYSILEEVLVLIYGLKSSHILPTSSVTNSNFCIIVYMKYLISIFFRFKFYIVR